MQNCDRETRGELQTASGFNNSDYIIALKPYSGWYSIFLHKTYVHLFHLPPYMLCVTTSKPRQIKALCMSHYDEVVTYSDEG
jgi:hypothetical protein